MMTHGRVFLMFVGLLATMWLTGCGNTRNDSAICDSVDRAALADAALADGGPVAQREALYVLDQLKAACG